MAAVWWHCSGSKHKQSIGKHSNFTASFFWLYTCNIQLWLSKPCRKFYLEGPCKRRGGVLVQDHFFQQESCTSCTSWRVPVITLFMWHGLLLYSDWHVQLYVWSQETVCRRPRSLWVFPDHCRRQVSHAKLLASLFPDSQASVHLTQPSQGPSQDGAAGACIPVVPADRWAIDS